MEGEIWKEKRLAKQRFWKVHIRAWERSGLTQNEYCRRNKLKSNQLTYWKTKFNQEKQEQVSFVPVPMNSKNQPQYLVDSDDSGLAIHLDKIKIKIHNNFNPATLVKVVSLLEDRS